MTTYSHEYGKLSQLQAEPGLHFNLTPPPDEPITIDENTNELTFTFSITRDTDVTTYNRAKHDVVIYFMPGPKATEERIFEGKTPVRIHVPADEITMRRYNSVNGVERKDLDVFLDTSLYTIDYNALLENPNGFPNGPLAKYLEQGINDLEGVFKDANSDIYYLYQFLEVQAFDGNTMVPIRRQLGQWTIYNDVQHILSLNVENNSIEHSAQTTVGTSSNDWKNYYMKWFWAETKTNRFVVPSPVPLTITKAKAPDFNIQYCEFDALIQ